MSMLGREPVESLGGPLIAIPVAQAATWRGSGDDGGHYELACAITGWVDVITFDGVEALVFWREPSRAVWIPGDSATACVGRVVRELAADSDDAATELFQRWSSRAEIDAGGAETDPPVSFSLRTSGLWLQDSALGGDEPIWSTPVVRRELIPLESNRYRVSTSYIEGDAAVLVVHSIAIVE